jgi:hypothetical protein
MRLKHYVDPTHHIAFNAYQQVSLVTLLSQRRHLHQTVQVTPGRLVWWYLFEEGAFMDWSQPLGPTLSARFLSQTDCAVLVLTPSPSTWLLE